MLLSHPQTKISLTPLNVLLNGLHIDNYHTNQRNYHKKPKMRPNLSFGK